jgi:hypothetical protein
MMKMFEINGWHYLTMQGVNIFVRSNFNKAFNQFWNKIMLVIDDNLVVGVLLKIQSSDGTIKSLGPLHRVTKSDRGELCKVLWFYIKSKGNDYTTLDISKITFQYIILGNKSEVSTEINNPIVKPVSSHSFGLFNNYKHMCLYPILSVQDKLLSNLSYLKNCNKNIKILENMLSDLESTQHTLFKEFLSNILYNKPINITATYTISNDIKNIKYNNYLLTPSLIVKNLTKPGVYLIEFNNKQSYYIGSSINIKKRFLQHKKQKMVNIFKSFNHKFDLNLTLTDKNLYYFFKFGSLYITIDYLKEFKYLYPNYKLSKGEWIILNKLTDLHVKILEQSLIYNYKPNLNKSQTVSYRFIEWRKEWLYYYDKESEYRKSSKVLHNKNDWFYLFKLFIKKLLGYHS